MANDRNASHQDEIQALSRLIAHPEMQRITEELLAAPESERLELANKIATPEALAARGVPVPEDVRITTRYFEEVSQGEVIGGPESGGQDERMTQTICFGIGVPIVMTYGVSW